MPRSTTAPTLQYNFEGAYYNAYNEPDLQAPFLYDYSGEPWKTQAVTRMLQLQVYNTTTGGIPGNDDLGTMTWTMTPSFLLVQRLAKPIATELIRLRRAGAVA